MEWLLSFDGIKFRYKIIILCSITNRLHFQAFLHREGAHWHFKITKKFHTTGSCHRENCALIQQKILLVVLYTRKPLLDGKPVLWNWTWGSLQDNVPHRPWNHQTVSPSLSYILYSNTLLYDHNMSKHLTDAIEAVTDGFVTAHMTLGQPSQNWIQHL